MTEDQATEFNLYDEAVSPDNGSTNNPDDEFSISFIPKTMDTISESDAGTEDSKMSSLKIELHPSESVQEKKSVLTQFLSAHPPISSPPPSEIKSESDEDSTTQGNKTVLYIGGLTWWTTDQQLEELLSKFGTVKKIRFYEDKVNGKSRGIAFVQFVDDASCVAAFEKLNGATLNGRQLTVSYASADSFKQLNTHNKGRKERREERELLKQQKTQQQQQQSQTQQQTVPPTSSTGPTTARGGNVHRGGRGRGYPPKIPVPMMPPTPYDYGMRMSGRPMGGYMPYPLPGAPPLHSFPHLNPAFFPNFPGNVPRNFYPFEGIEYEERGDRDRSKSREREEHRSKSGSRASSKDRNKGDDRGEERDRERDRSRDRDNEREKDRDRDRERQRDKERRSPEKGQKRSREKSPNESKQISKKYKESHFSDRR